MKTIRVLASLGVLGTLGASLPADAATYIAPGISCRNQDPADDDDMMWWYHGQIANVGTNAVRVNCGLTRHNATANLSGTVYARVWNQTAAAMSCTLNALPSHAQTGGDFENGSVALQGNQSITFNAANLTLYTYGKYVLGCNLDPSDRLDSVRYTEP